MKKASFFVAILALLQSFFYLPARTYAQSPSVNCPTSVNTQARLVASYQSKFTNQDDFDYFYSRYKKFLTLFDPVSGKSYYRIFFGNSGTNPEWSVKYYELLYTYPTFPNAKSLQPLVDFHLSPLS
jgi:hypothetical protein